MSGAASGVSNSRVHWQHCSYPLYLHMVREGESEKERENERECVCELERELERERKPSIRLNHTSLAPLSPLFQPVSLFHAPSLALFLSLL